MECQCKVCKLRAAKQAVEEAATKPEDTGHEQVHLKVDDARVIRLVLATMTLACQKCLRQGGDIAPARDNFCAALYACGISGDMAEVLREDLET